MQYLFFGVVCTLLCFPLMGQSDTISEQLAEVELKQVYTSHKATSIQYIDLKTITNTDRTLLSSLEQISGFHIQSVGSEQKPIIRDMNMHRVNVLNHFIRIEGQDWGNDHGVDINDVGIPKVVSVMGTSSLLYDSHSVLGLINTYYTTDHSHDDIHFLQSYHQGVNLLSSEITWGNESTPIGEYFVGYKYSIATDRKVNDDSGEYLSVYIPLKDGIVTNTASRKHQLVFYWIPTNDWESISQYTYTKIGFFAAAHGMPTKQKITPDTNHWDIQLPRQEVSHFSQTTSHKWKMENAQLKSTLSFQHNIRQELSKFFTHYPMPNVIPTNLEYDMRLTSLQLKEMYTSPTHRLSLDMVYQNNSIDGYGFFLPEYSLSKWAIGYTYTQQLSSIKVESGVRLEQRTLGIKGYYDQNIHNYLTFLNFDHTVVTQSARQSRSVDEFRHNIAASATLSWKVNPEWKTQLTAAYITRMPHPVELSVNGIHHGAFRHELGDPNLDNEQGTNLTLGIDWSTDLIHFNLLTYYTWYTNYIYINPTGRWSYLPDMGQIYAYQQSNALHRGIELDLEITWNKLLSTKGSFEYLTKHILDDQWNLDKYELMTPPMELKIRMNYTPLEALIIYGESQFVAKQEQVAPSENKTGNYTLYNLGVQNSFELWSTTYQLDLSIDNLLDKAYLNHTSYLRQIGIGELGRRLNAKLNIYF